MKRVIMRALKDANYESKDDGRNILVKIRGAHNHIVIEFHDEPVITVFCDISQTLERVSIDVATSRRSFASIAFSVGAAVVRITDCIWEREPDESEDDDEDEETGMKMIKLLSADKRVLVAKSDHAAITKSINKSGKIRYTVYARNCGRCCGTPHFNCAVEYFEGITEAIAAGYNPCDEWDY